jgi:hypothetical protein
MCCHSAIYRLACSATHLAAGKQAPGKAPPETIAALREKEKANTENMRKHER